MTTRPGQSVASLRTTGTASSGVGGAGGTGLCARNYCPIRPPMIGPPATPSARPPPSARAQRTQRLATATLAGFAVLLLSSQGAGGALTQGKTVVSLTPPYLGATPYGHSSKYSGGCNSRDGPGGLRSFNASSGQVRYGAWVFTKRCNGFGGHEKLVADVGAANIGFTVPATGTYDLSAHWSVNAVSNTSLWGTGVGTSTAIRPYLCLDDLTTRASFCRAGAPFVSVQGTTNSSQLISANATQIIRSVNLSSGDSYIFKTFLGIVLDAYVNGSSAVHSSARLSFDMATPGEGATLISLKVF
jgi:hypothetical protein